jgi:putative ABC transport system permease protein
MLIGAVERFASEPLGIDPNGLVTAAVRLPKTGYGDAAARARFYERLTSELSGTAGVQAAAVSSTLPIGGGGETDVMEVEGKPAPPDLLVHDSHVQMVSPNYFKALRTPLKMGRVFGPADTTTSEPVAIVNEALARKYFEGDNPVGRHIRPFAGGKGERTWLRVVGVVGDEKRTTVYNEMAWVDPPILYRPVNQNAPLSAHLLVRAPFELGTAMQRKAAAIDPDAAVEFAQTARSLEARALQYPRFRAVLLSAFAVLALTLAAMGLFGVLSYLVSHRTHEIGVRMALGAQPSVVQTMILREGMVLVSAGVVFGAGAAWAMQRFIGLLMYGMQGVDLRIMAAALALLFGAAVAAMWAPARRASQVDPMVALKWD